MLNGTMDLNKDFKKFKCIKFQTDKYINRSYIVLFHEGSSIIEAVLLKKKIINIDGKSLLLLQRLILIIENQLLTLWQRLLQI